MQLIAPDILAEAVGLSPLACGVFFLIGALLWFVGGLGHRFWVVLAATLIAGVVGLYHGPSYGMKPLVAGLLLAVAIGSLALALFRILLFIASGFAVMWLTGAIFPSWSEQIACFLAGGLLGIAMFRICVTALTSFGGTLVMGYSGLSLASFASVDVVKLVEERQALCNWSVAALTVVGMLVQFLIQRRRGSAVAKLEDNGESDEKKSKKEKKEKKAESASWLGWLRQAG
jgi:hypothetical protein